MATEIGIVDLLNMFGFDESLPTKIVRHQDERHDMWDLQREGWFELYQSLQHRNVFKNCEQIVSCVGDGSARARFVGVYRILDQSRPPKRVVPHDCPYAAQWRKLKFHYEMERVPKFVGLEGRVVIEWESERSWHQKLRNKSVVEMFPKGRVLDPFTDYLDFTLSYDQLVDLSKQSSAHQDWKSSLEAVSGVYMILNEPSGQQYVGSAYGVKGIWGRWTTYARTGHGGNVRLRKLVSKKGKYPKSFRFSVLQVLPKSATKREVIQWEALYKTKLGSRAIGLNLN
jgi:hypothetical protein